MPERDLQARIRSILERRVTLIPLIDPATVPMRENVDEFLSMEERAHRDNLEKIRELLNTYGISLHAAYTDLLNHPEHLLQRFQYSDVPGPAIQFAIFAPNRDGLNFVTMKPQKIKFNGKDELFCADTLFCLTPTSALRQLRTTLVATHFHHSDTTCFPMEFTNFPQIYQHWTYFIFDKKGRISHLVHNPHPSKRTICFDLSDKKGGELIVWVDGYGLCSEKLPYRYCPGDQTLRREPATSNTSTMQEEIVEILSKLPMPLENYDVLSQFS